MTQRAMVTGATGFIGTAVARGLIERGWTVRLLCRDDADDRNLVGLGPAAQRVSGDLCDLDSVVRAVDGCSHIFHVAGRYRFGLRESRALFRDNLEGTRNVIAAARTCRVERVIYTSTVGVLDPKIGAPLADENSLADFHKLAGPYKRSKWLADREVVRAVTEGLPAVIVCPTAPVGPFDVKPTPTGKMIVDFLCGRMPADVDTGLNLAPVEDVAVGHVLAAERGKIGDRYILGGQNLTLREIFMILASFTGRSAPRFRVPKIALVPIAYVSEALAGIFGGTPRLTLENARMSQSYMFFDSSRASRELGYTAGSVEDALRRAVDWFVAAGYAPSSVVSSTSPAAASVPPRDSLADAEPNAISSRTKRVSTGAGP
jgi:dihydroflavonol-4-reductase